MIFVETAVFTRRVKALLGEVEYAKLQRYLADAPETGDVIEGAGGLRKVRVALACHGKSGGARVIYYYFASRARIAMLFIYAKNERDDLDAEQRKALKAIIATWNHGT